MSRRAALSWIVTAQEPEYITRHSHESGNPGSRSQFLDPRFRGDDGVPGLLSWIFLISSLFSCASVLANVEDTECEKGISVASGHGVSDIVPIRIGMQKSFGYPWAHRTRCPIGGYFEASAYSLNGKKGRYNPNSNTSAQALALAAVLRFQHQTEILAVYPYLDLGLGASWFSKKEIGGRELGIHFEFEDRLGLGFRFGKNQQLDFCYRAVHFSNAYLGQKNHGINLHLLVLGYWFT